MTRQRWRRSQFRRLRSFVRMNVCRNSAPSSADDRGVEGVDPGPDQDEPGAADGLRGPDQAAEVPLGADRLEHDPAEPRPRAGLCWVVLEAVRSEGNLGTLIRTSEAIGGAGFILVGPGIDPFDPAVVRALMGRCSGRRSSGRTTAASGTGSAAIAAASSAPRPTGRPSSIASTIPARRSSSSARSARASAPSSATSARTSSASRWSARPTP